MLKIKNPEFVKQIIAGFLVLIIISIVLFFSFEIDLVKFAFDYGYLGVFLISIIGTATIVFPAPYTIALFFIASLQTFDPLVLSLIAGFGAAIGESVSYLLGFAGRNFVSEKNWQKIELYRKIFEKYGFFAIFVFSATPLPDDLLYIPVGMMKYNFVKFFVAAFIGKTVMSAVIIYSGFYSVSLIDNVLFLSLIGLLLVVGLIVFCLNLFFKNRSK